MYSGSHALESTQGRADLPQAVHFRKIVGSCARAYATPYVTSRYLVVLMTELPS